MDTEAGEHFLEQSRHFLNDEYRTKLRQAVAALPADAIWWRPNDESNSVGNLLLHLAGNIRQWIVAGVGGATITRNRAAEFAARDGATRETLLADLERALDEVDRVLAGVTPARLTERAHIQGRDVTVLGAIFHVVEHFGYHLGQIVFVSKETAPGRVKFYEDAGGLARPLWNQ